MNRVLISTIYNEAKSIERWIDAIKAQTVQPDQFIIVDGGSQDGTVEILRKGFEKGTFPKPDIIVQRCNIAEGRNLAIQNSTHEIIASVDAGSIPDRTWLEEITKPFQDNFSVGVVGGHCPMAVNNTLQKMVEKLEGICGDDLHEESVFFPSSRNVAFRRGAWAAVGGYPEWLTLTAEDALFNANLHAAGIRFYYQPSAIVSWEMPPNLKGYLKMMCNYGYGSAEMGQTPHLYHSWLLTTLIPPLILFSPYPFSYVPFRYLRNSASSWGWVKGKIKGRKPPKGWQCINGTWLSPQTIVTVNKTRAASQN